MAHFKRFICSWLLLWAASCAHAWLSWARLRLRPWQISFLTYRHDDGPWPATQQPLHRCRHPLIIMCEIKYIATGKPDIMHFCAITYSLELTCKSSPLIHRPSMVDNAAHTERQLKDRTSIQQFDLCARSLNTCPQHEECIRLSGADVHPTVAPSGPQ